VKKFEPLLPKNPVEKGLNRVPLPGGLLPIGLEAARSRFPGAIEALEKLDAAPGTDPAGRDVLFVGPDGLLYVGNTLDGMYDSWSPERGWGEAENEEVIRLLDGE